MGLINDYSFDQLRQTGLESNSLQFKTKLEFGAYKRSKLP